MTKRSRLICGQSLGAHIQNYLHQEILNFSSKGLARSGVAVEKASNFKIKPNAFKIYFKSRHDICSGRECALAMVVWSSCDCFCMFPSSHLNCSLNVSKLKALTTSQPSCQALISNQNTFSVNFSKLNKTKHPLTLLRQVSHSLNASTPVLY